MTDTFAANLTALVSAGHPVTGLQAASSRVRIEPRAGSDPDVRISPDGDRWVRLHSARDPLAEAERWIAEPMAGHPLAPVCVVGAGAGYVLEALEARNAGVRVVVVEPDAALARAMLARRDWRSWIASGRVRLLVGPAYEGAAGARGLLESDEPATLLTSAVLAREWPADVAAASEVARRLIFDAAGNREARRKTAGLYLLNTLRNLPWLAHSGDVARLQGLARGLPAVVAAAGPSLPANVADAGEALAGALIISADTALRPLLRLGITPRLVVGLDPTPTNAQHFFSLQDTDDVWLVGEGSLSPGVFGEFPGRAFAFQVSGHHPWPWLERAGLGRGRLRAWGSVLTAAYHLAVWLECDPIVFVGADMAFPGGQPYARGTTYEETWAASVVGGLDLPGRFAWEIQRRSDVLTESDVRGRDVTTTATLRSFRDWFITAVREDGGRRVLNATGAGIFLGDGVAQIEASRIGELVRPSHGLAERLHAAHQHDRDGWRRLRDLARGLVERGDAADGSPLEAWDGFALGTVERRLVLGALDEAAANLGEAPPVIPPPDATVAAARRLEREWRSRRFDGLYHPERIAIVAARLAGAPLPGWVEAPPAPSDREALVPLLDLALTGLSALDRDRDVLASAGLPESVPAMGADTTPASAIADWRPGPRRLVWAIETLIAQVLRSNAALPPSPSSEWITGETAALEQEPRVSNGSLPDRNPPDREVSEADAPVPEGSALAAREAFARLQLLRELAIARAAVDRDDARLLRVAAVCTVMARALALRLTGSTGTAPDAAAADAEAEVTLAPAGDSGVTARAAIHSAQLTRLFTGWTTAWPVEPASECRRTLRVTSGASAAVVEVKPSGGAAPSPRRDILFAHAGAIHEPRLVSPDGALFNHVATLDACSALATGFGVAGSVRVHEDGRVTPEPAWPGPIDGEVPFGEGRLAWTGTLVRPGEREGVVRWRDASHGGPWSMPVPFVALNAVMAPGGPVYWPSLTGGLWRWSPGSGAEQVLGGEPLVNALPETGSLRLEPIELTAGRVSRVESCSRHLRDDGRIEPCPIDPLGAVWSRAASAGITADAHPHADCVIVADAQKRRLALVAYYPIGVAWAGRSLLVLSATGHLLLFEGLHARL